MLDRLSLRIRILLFFAFLLVGAVGAVVLAAVIAVQRGGYEAIPPGIVQGALASGFALVGLIVWVWFLFDANVARAIETLSTAIRARVHAGIEHDLAAEAKAARYLGDLAPAVEEIAKSLVNTRNALAQSVARETTRLAAEKSRLETLLADVPVAVLLCTFDHQLVFYNGQAVDILGSGGAPGLDRPLLDYLRAGPIRHAYERLSEAGDPDLASDLLTATVVGGRLLAGRMRVLRRQREGVEPGYVLTLRDVTTETAAHARMETLLTETFERIRRPSANLQTLQGVRADLASDSPTPDLDSAMHDEIHALVATVTELSKRYEAVQSEWQPLVSTRAWDLLDGVKARLADGGQTVETVSLDLLLQVDGFTLVTFWAWVSRLVSDHCKATDLCLRIEEEDGPGAKMVLEWHGEALSVGVLDGWMREVISDSDIGLTAQSVLREHGTEIWSEAREGGGVVVMPIRAARRAVRRPPPLARKVVYDFDLLTRGVSPDLAERRLDEMTYVVFDTETTGLAPSTDEIVQIAAVRIVNGRRVVAEVFDTLVDPQRPIPRSSTEVHGITESMVVGAPTMDVAGRQFHRFAQGAVLVAHNAPFDMEFLRRHEKTIGKVFDNPILDTVLLSAVVFGQLEEHTLDALTNRLGITIPEEARHTAIGDTVATADAFLKLLPMLKARGIETFGQVLTEVRRHGRLIKDLN